MDSGTASTCSAVRPTFKQPPLRAHLVHGPEFGYHRVRDERVWTEEARYEERDSKERVGRDANSEAAPVFSVGAW